MLNAPEVTELQPPRRRSTIPHDFFFSQNVEACWVTSKKAGKHRLRFVDEFKHEQSINDFKCLFAQSNLFVLRKWKLLIWIYCRVKICWNKLTVNFLLSLAWIKIVQFPLIIRLVDLWRLWKYFVCRKSDFRLAGV